VTQSRCQILDMCMIKQRTEIPSLSKQDHFKIPPRVNQYRAANALFSRASLLAAQFKIVSLNWVEICVTISCALSARSLSLSLSRAVCFARVDQRKWKEGGGGALCPKNTASRAAHAGINLKFVNGPEKSGWSHAAAFEVGIEFTSNQIRGRARYAQTQF
jgi:hypothetical protein